MDMENAEAHADSADLARKTRRENPEPRRVLVLEIVFPEGTGDYYAGKLADQIVDFAGCSGKVTIVEEGLEHNLELKHR